jgi:hypothetical protein
MNRSYVKPTVNPAFKRCQPLPALNVILKGKDNGRLGFPVTGLNQQPSLATHEPSRGGFISSCKNFAFTNLF